jgi:hypothetical protein
MASSSKPRFNVAAHVSQRPAASPDDLLFAAAPAGSAPAPAARPEDEKLRFGSQLPAPTLIQLHRLAYWTRTPLNELLDEALQLLFATRPEAATPLPEKERTKRKLPAA